MVYSLHDGAYIRTIRYGAAVPRSSFGRSQESPLDGCGLPSSRDEVTWIGVSARAHIVSYVESHSVLYVHSVNGKLLCQCEIDERLNEIRFSEDGNHIITGGTARLVLVRSLNDSLRVVQRLDGACSESLLLPNGMPPFEAAIRTFSVTPGEAHLIVALDNGQIRIVAYDAQYLRDRLQARLSELGF